MLIYFFDADDPKSKKSLRGARRKALAASDPKEHILIVDDEKRIVENEQEILEKLGYQVTGRTSSKEALEAVRQQPEKFDLVITDFIMPQMNGVELARELNRIRPDMPIILYTTFDRIISAENGKKIGIEKYLIKPVKTAELHQAIRRVLDEKLSKGGFKKE
jgi:CheY-like chemotaxis protein